MTNIYDKLLSYIKLYMRSHNYIRTPPLTRSLCQKRTCTCWNRCSVKKKDGMEQKTVTLSRVSLVRWGAMYKLKLGVNTHTHTQIQIQTVFPESRPKCQQAEKWKGRKRYQRSGCSPGASRLESASRRWPDQSWGSRQALRSLSRPPDSALAAQRAALGGTCAHDTRVFQENLTDEKTQGWIWPVGPGCWLCSTR